MRLIRLFQLIKCQKRPWHENVVFSHFFSIYLHYQVRIFRCLIEKTRTLRVTLSALLFDPFYRENKSINLVRAADALN